MVGFNPYSVRARVEERTEMAITLMAPLILEVDSILQESDKKDAFDRLCSVYGPTYSKQKDLLSLLNLCVQDNKINPGNTVPLKECLASTEEKQNEIGAIVQRFEVENASAIKEWEGSQPSEFIGRDIGRLGSILERFDGVILWGKFVFWYKGPQPIVGSV